jgi:transglutaminase-like putative cysteine protease
MLIRIGYDIELSVATPMALIYLLRVHPSRRDDLVAPESVLVSGGLVPEEYLDSFGNHCGRVNVPVGMPTVRITNDALIRDSGELDEVDPDARQRDPTELPFSTLQFLLPSRYCEVDSELLPFAWQKFGGITSGWQRVAAICDFVHDHLTFNYKTARPTRTALDAFREKEGVCRDFTHLAVTLCRCMNIPARYTTGYLGDIGVPAAPYPMDFSAWFEVFLGDRWFTFDARHNERRVGRIVMARGRDAGDVPITMCFGANSLLRFDVLTEEVVEPVAAAAV